MGLDIKIPIGMMFSLLGIILTILGLVTAGNEEMYVKSLDHNINLWSGLFMVAFGAFMLLTSKLFKKRKSDESLEELLTVGAEEDEQDSPSQEGQSPGKTEP